MDPDAPGTGAAKVVETRDYYPFGLRMPGRSVTTGTPAVEDYTGHELDGEANSSAGQTGMHYAGARYYMGALGRWTTTDPILREPSPRKLLKDGKVQAFSMSAYNYSFNNPVNLKDDTGAWPTPWDVLDFAAAGLSIRDAWNDPSAANIGWAAADVAAAALPIIPSSGIYRHGTKLIAGSDEAADLVKGAVNLENFGSIIKGIGKSGDRVVDDQIGALSNILGDQVNAERLSGALKENNGIELLRPDGSGKFNHVDAVEDALDGISKRIGRIQDRIGGGKLSDEQQEVAQQWVDALKQYEENAQTFINQNIPEP